MNFIFLKTTTVIKCKFLQVWANLYLDTLFYKLQLSETKITKLLVMKAVMQVNHNWKKKLV